MKINIGKYPLVIFIGLLVACQVQEDEGAIREQILDNGQVVRNAFAEGDLETIKSLHHPDVTKALAYGDLKNGREEVIQGIEEALEHYSLEFVENIVEKISIYKDLAIEQSRFSIKGSPKKDGEPFVFSGRTVVTYVRYEDSPTGWATIHEIIQPATD